MDGNVNRNLAVTMLWVVQPVEHFGAFQPHPITVFQCLRLFVSSLPHPPFGHLLLKEKDKGGFAESIWRVATASPKIEETVGVRLSDGQFELVTKLFLADTPHHLLVVFLSQQLKAKL